MKIIVIKYNSTSFSIQQNRKVLWLYRLELAIYSVGFLVIMYFMYSMSESSMMSKLTVIGTLAIVFSFVIIRKRKSLSKNDFLLEKINDGFCINGTVATENIAFGSIEIKEMVSTYSTSSYYDIIIKVNDKGIPVAFGIDESDKDTIMGGLRYLLGGGVSKW
ncbi:MAG: hypothetical protein J0M30_13755 [Chitinophagales bacterium]|nr:hypothetical protein [Chitinophagales bacterium]